MDLRNIESFVMLCQCENYTRAAERLYISQPTLSKRIASMEMELGCELIDRNSPVFSLTPFGREYLAQSKLIMSTHDQVDRRIKQVLSGAIKPFVVYHRHISSWLIAPCISAMMEIHPELEFSFKAYKDYTDVSELLLRKEADAVLGIREDFERHQGINYRVIKKTNYGVVCCYNHKLYKERTLSLAQIVNEPIVFLSSTNLKEKHTLAKFLERQGFNTRNFVYVNDISSVHYYLATGKHIFLSGLDAEQMASIPGFFKRIPLAGLEIMNGDIAIAYRPDDLQAKVFADLCIDRNELIKSLLKSANSFIKPEYLLRKNCILGYPALFSTGQFVFFYIFLSSFWTSFNPRIKKRTKAQPFM